MGLLPRGLLALIYVFTSSTSPSLLQRSSSSISLSSDVTAKIPSCAQTCFSSFVDANFPSSTCTSNPTLDCLCTHNSTSGYTIGEGAVQCILSEVNVGFCQGANGSTQVTQDAYNMCAGKMDALPNTHATLTATLVVQSSNPSIVMIAPTAATPVTTISSSASVTASSSPSSTKAANTAPSTSSKTTAGPSTTTPTAQAPSQTAEASPSSSGLSPSQIAGITVAGVGAAALAVGGIALVACLRRRRMARRESTDSLPFQMGPDIGAVNGFRGPTEKPLGYYGPGRYQYQTGGKIAPRVPPPPLETDPNMFSRRTIRPEEIGVAISPETRHSSKLLPDKPTLTIQVPQQAKVSNTMPLSFPMPPQNNPADLRFGQGRESAMTQFEEDAADAYGYGDSYGNYGAGRGSTDGMLPAEAPGNYQPQIPRISLPADTTVRPLNIQKAQASFSQPLRPITAGSSIYSARGSPPPSANGRDSEAGMYNWRPPRQQTYKQYIPYRRPGTGDRESEGSVTSIDTQETTLEASGPDGRASEQRPVDLSPVVESPVGRSPVSYPKIPSLSPTDSKGMPLLFPISRPEQPDFGEPYRRQPPERGKPRERDRPRAPQVQRDYMAPSAAYNNTLGTPTRAPRNEQPPRSDSALSNSSNTSSLLAKRRGDKQAAALKLTTTPTGESEAEKRRRWRVLKEEQINAAKRADWRPSLGTGQTATQMVEPERERERERAELPATPKWTPTLKPTRVGDRLYLDVS